MIDQPLPLSKERMQLQWHLYVLEGALVADLLRKVPCGEFSTGGQLGDDTNKRNLQNPAGKERGGR